VGGNAKAPLSTACDSILACAKPAVVLGLRVLPVAYWLWVVLSCVAACCIMCIERVDVT